MTAHRKIMAFLSVIVGASAAKWAVNEWTGSGNAKRGWIIGIAGGAIIVAFLGLLRSVGLL